MEEIVLLFELDKYKFLFIYRLTQRGLCRDCLQSARLKRERDILI